MTTTHAKVGQRGKQLLREWFLQNAEAELATAFLSYHWFSNCCLMTAATARTTPCSRTVVLFLTLTCCCSSFCWNLGSSVVRGAFSLVSGFFCVYDLCCWSCALISEATRKQILSVLLKKGKWRQELEHRWFFFILTLCSVSAVSSEFEYDTHVNAHTITCLFVGRFTLISIFFPHWFPVGCGLRM